MMALIFEQLDHFRFSPKNPPAMKQKELLSQLFLLLKAIGK
jgi:hypothetical protein